MDALCNSTELMSKWHTACKDNGAKAYTEGECAKTVKADANYTVVKHPLSLITAPSSLAAIIRVPFNERDVGKWYVRAAQGGDVHAQMASGLLYAYGQGELKQDDQAAMKWLDVAANKGHRAALINLATMYKQKYGENDDEAVRYMLAAAEQGDVAAQEEMFVRHALGHGVEKDDDEAAKWLINRTLARWAHRPRNTQLVLG